MNYVIIPKEDFAKIQLSLKLAQETISTTAEMLENIVELTEIFWEVSK